MENNILYYKVKLKCLGPVHIGSGNNLSNIEYVFDASERKLYVMDEKKLFDGLVRMKLIDRYEKMITNPKGINLSIFFRENNITANVYKSWSRYSYSMGNPARNTIALCTKDAYGMPYIPGSSLKGAIRTAVLASEILGNPNQYIGIKNSIKTNSAIPKGKKSYLSQERNRLEEQAFATLDIDGKNASRDIFRGLTVSDSKPLPLESIILCQKIDCDPTGNEHSLPIYRECIKPGTIIEFDVKIDTSLFHFDDKKLYKCLEMMYNNLWNNYLRCFKNGQKAEGNLFYLGGGAGFPSKTVDYPVLGDDNDAMKIVAKILDTVDSTNNGKKIGNHLKDLQRGAAPHMLKCTKIGGKMYEFGLCDIDFKPMT